MKVALLYPYICNKADHYRPDLNRFLDTLDQFPAGHPFDLFIEMCGGQVYQGEDGARLEDAYHSMPDYFGDGWDIGAHQHAANCLPPEYDFMICCCAHTFFHREGWLERMVWARETYGAGLYGAMASNENNPHIRTCFFGFDPFILRGYPNVINSRDRSLAFESGPFPMGFTPWVASQCLAVKMVAWDGIYGPGDWRKPDNIFRRGDQSNCLVWDRHTWLYRDASPEQKAATEAGANG